MDKEDNERMELPNNNRCFIPNSSVKMVPKNRTQNTGRRDRKISKEKNNWEDRKNPREIWNKQIKNKGKRRYN